MKYKVHINGMEPIEVSEEIADQIHAHISLTNEKSPFFEVTVGKTVYSIVAAHVVAIESSEKKPPFAHASLI